MLRGTSWWRRFVYYGLTVAIGVSLARAQSCFDEANPLTCSSEGIQVDESLDVQTACSILDSDYFFYEIPLELSEHAEALSGIPADDELCNDFRQAYHLCYWCTPNITSDEYCFFNTCEKPNVLDESVDLDATCNELEALLELGKWPATIDLCYRGEHAKHHCPVMCEEVLPAYLGADTTPKKRALIWMSRTAAILSFFGACYILWDILPNTKNRSTVYHQLLVGMACFDIVTATAWSFATRPIPEEEAWYIEGAKGNEHTCTAQAFFIQLGFTSIFYNVSLALYYVLVIVYSWREGHLKTIRTYLHGIPLLAGLVLAFGGIPMYDWIEYSCHFVPPPGDELWVVLVFAVLPIGFSILCITLAMVVVYVSVRRKSRVTRKWTFRSLRFGDACPLEQRVFWSALLYTLSFFITWPVVFCVYTSSVDAKVDRYGFSMLVAFVAPLQGFTNFLVYIRPKVFKVKNFALATSLVRRTVAKLSRSEAGQGGTTGPGPSLVEPSPLAEMDPSAYIAQGAVVVGVEKAVVVGGDTSPEAIGVVEQTQMEI